MRAEREGGSRAEFLERSAARGGLSCSPGRHPETMKTQDLRAILGRVRCDYLRSSPNSRGAHFFDTAADGPRPDFPFVRSSDDDQHRRSHGMGDT